MPAVNLVFSVCLIGCHVFSAADGSSFYVSFFIYLFIFCQFLKCASANSSNPVTSGFWLRFEINACQRFKAFCWQRRFLHANHNVTFLRY